MKCLSGLLVSLSLALPVASPVIAQEASTSATQKIGAVLPLPATPIAVPVLSPTAGKAELVKAYYDITGGRMFEVLIAQSVKPPAKLQAKVAGCPAAEQYMQEQYREVITPHFRGWLDSSIRPRITQVLSEAFGEAELRAFLRFAATPNGQRHLNQIGNQSGKGDVSHFPEFLQDAELRAYDRQFDALGGRVDEVLGNAHADLMTPQFMEQARNSGKHIADLVMACQEKADT
ncbi:hypothetical protein [Solilutibacter tolerans]|uniref:DUF2059 domain-containing protein n=1 Tax=Solilutibacter tolerans TaxID=1604334 RepID=A0A1N6TVN0_9GAMM|nr:hypothetical protein [Lysobacter tolerans]SIQ57126.1 hypothetical protein SAMN05421546_1474 [Lysobacter tolerans]